MNTFYDIANSFNWLAIDEDDRSGHYYRMLHLRELQNTPLTLRIHQRGLKEKMMIRQLGEHYPEIKKRKSRSAK